jgi:hypothetical protein
MHFGVWLKLEFRIPLLLVILPPKDSKKCYVHVCFIFESDNEKMRTASELTMEAVN